MVCLGDVAGCSSAFYSWGTHKVKAIFSEELVNPKLAEAIAKETGAKVYMLNPVEGLTEEQMKAGATYLSVMEDNLKVLKTALGGQ